MRSASTTERTTEIKTALKSSNLKTHLYLEAYDSTDTPIVVNDLDVVTGVNWRKSTKKPKHGANTLTPLTSTVDFKIINEAGKYSEGSGTIDDGLFDIGTKIRLNAGYKMDTLGAATTTLTADLTSTRFGYIYYTRNTSTYIELNPGNVGGTTVNFFTDLFNPFYDGTTYDTDTYSADAFYVYDFDLIQDGFSEVTEINITANNTEGTIYYRNITNLDDAKFSSNLSTDWTNGGATSNGTVTIAPSGTPDKKHFLVAVVYDGISWGDDLQITTITLKHKTFMEWIYKDIFYLDTPTFVEPAAPGQPTIRCSGRDSWKNIVETSINIEDLTAGVQIDDLIKSIADKALVEYNSTSIADLSAYDNRTLATGLGGVAKAVSPLENMMQILNKATSPTSSKYQMYLEYDSTLDENILFTTAKPTAFTADFVFNYKKYTSLGARRKNFDKILKLATVLTDNPGTGPELTLDSSLLQTGTGDQAFSWVNNSGHKRVDFSTSAGGFSITAQSLTPIAATITVTAGTGTGTWSITIYGQEWTGADPIFEGEAINPTNNPRGNSNTFINPFLISDAEAKDVADGMVNDFADPVKEANAIRYPYMNLLLEQNDFCLVWSRFNFIDDLHLITGIGYHWDHSSNPADSTTFNLDDSGQDFSDIAVNGFIYDDILDYDIGYVYDMQYGPAATQAEAEAAFVPVLNVGFS